MMVRNVPYGSGCWMAETGFHVGHQREVGFDNRDHMYTEGLSDCPAPSPHISDTCVMSHGGEMCVHAQLCIERAHIKLIYGNPRSPEGDGKRTPLQNSKHLIKCFISKILSGVPIMSSAANTEELQLVLVANCLETRGQC